MKILHIDTGDVWRGGQAQIFHAIREMQKLSGEHHLLGRPESEIMERAEQEDVGDHRLTHPMRGEWDLSAFWYLARLHSEQEYDLIHVNDPHGHGVAWGASFFGSLPEIVVTRRLEKPVAGNWFSRKKYQWADHYVAISTSVRDVLVECGIDNEKIVIIPEGVDVESVRETEPTPSVLEELGLDPEKPVIGNVGALCEQKDQFTLIRAASKVIEKHPDTQFVIAGKGELEEELNQLIDELGIEDQCKLAGFHDNIIGLIKTFDLFVLTSIWEGLCSTLLQVMASEVPIIATNVGGVPDVIDDGRTGMLIPEKNPEATAKAIEQFLETPQIFEKYVINAGDEVSEFDYEQIAERIHWQFKRWAK